MQVLKICGSALSILDFWYIKLLHLYQYSNSTDIVNQFHDKNRIITIYTKLKHKLDNYCKTLKIFPTCSLMENQIKGVALTNILHVKWIFSQHLFYIYQKDGSPPRIYYFLLRTQKGKRTLHTCTNL